MAGKRPRRAATAMVGLAALIAAAACAQTPALAASGVALHRVGDFDAPIDVVAAPGVRRVVYVVERPGQIVAVRGHHRRGFLDISGRTTTDGERGLLSIAFSPRFATDHVVYAYYTNRHGNIEVDSFKASSRRAHPGSRRKVIVVPHPGQSNHNGGQLQFGPDGYLYLATGDGGGAGDQPGNAQNLNSLLGKVLRIIPRPSGGQQYSVPASNPFAGAVPGLDEIWSYGLRNPWRFSFDMATGDLLIGDVGQGAREEVDDSPASSGAGRGLNFGWNCREGFTAYPFPAAS